MRNLPVLALAAVCAGLAAALAWVWVGTDGRLRGVNWSPPPPVAPAVPAVTPAPAPAPALTQYVATLERPLFSPTRRPPPPPAAPPPPDPLDDVQVLGVYGAGDHGGALLRRRGEVRRVPLGGDFGGWTLGEARGSELVLRRGEESRTLQVQRQIAAAADAGAAAAAASPAAGTPAAAAHPNPQAQRDLEMVRQRVREMNRLRARMGLPPLPEP